MKMIYYVISPSSRWTHIRHSINASIFSQQNILTEYCVHQIPLGCKQLEQYKVDEAKRGYIGSWNVMGEAGRVLWRAKQLVLVMPWDRCPEDSLHFLLLCLFTHCLHYPLLCLSFFYMVGNHSPWCIWSHIIPPCPPLRKDSFSLAENLWTTDCPSCSMHPSLKPDVGVWGC